MANATLDDLAAEIFKNSSDYAAQYLRCFSRSIAHGDLEHQGWLRDAAEAFIKGEPLPPPRGKGTQEAQSDAEKQIEEATRYAEQLAISLAARWYPEVSQWKSLSGDLIGLLTQIDNMTTGAVRAQSDAEPVAINDAKEQALSEIFVKGFEDGRAHELSAIAAAIGSNRFMDPPDGGDVSLAEQVCRMREALEKAEAALAQSDAGPKRAQLRLEEDAQGKRAMLGGYQMPDALIPSLEAEPHEEIVKIEPREFVTDVNILGRVREQSDAGPVAWQWRAKYTNGWSKWTEASEEVAKCNGSQGQCEWRALYAAPPCPDASAGLIEAAEIVYAKWDKLSDSDPKACGDMWELYNELRARAAERSGK